MSNSKRPSTASNAHASPGGVLSAIDAALRAVCDDDLDAAACDVGDAAAMLGVPWELPSLRDIPRPSIEVLLHEARDALRAGDEVHTRHCAALALAMLLLETEAPRRKRKAA